MKNVLILAAVTVTSLFTIFLTPLPVFGEEAIFKGCRCREPVVDGWTRSKRGRAYIYYASSEAIVEDENSRQVSVRYIERDRFADSSSLEEVKSDVRIATYKECKEMIKSLKKERICSGSSFSIAGEDEDEFFNESDL